MKTRKQLPCFGYIENQLIDIDALKIYLNDSGLLDINSYNDVKYSSASDLQEFISLSQSCYDNHFKANVEPSLESSVFRQIALTKLDRSKVRTNEDRSPTSFFDRFRRINPKNPRYTAYIDELNYGIRSELVQGEIEKIFDIFSSKITRARLTFLSSGHEITAHVDYDPSYVTRYHIPIITHPDVVMHIQRQNREYRLHMPADGRIFFFNAGLKHRVTNRSPIDRLHMIIDVHGQVELENLKSLDDDYVLVDG